MKVAIVTGSKGFVGKHLTKLLNEKGIKVIGLDLPEVNLNDEKLVDEIIYTEKPDYIFHLAAKAFVPTSFDNEWEVLENNIKPFVNIVKAVKKYGLSTKIHIACSSEQYGLVHPKDTPIKETNVCDENSPYAISKTTMEKMAKWYSRKDGIHIVITRAFNHTGPGRGEQYVTSSFAKQIAQLELGMDYWTYDEENEKLKPVIEVGNLDSERDFTDVRDMVEAYWLAINKCKSGETYNICSKNSIMIGDMLDILCDLSTLKGRIEVVKKESRMRKSEVPLLFGDNSKFIEQTGWKPKYNFENTMEDLLEYWRNKIKG